MTGLKFERNIGAQGEVKLSWDLTSWESNIHY